MLLKKGNTGSAITVLQNILRELDYSVALTGTFDTATYNAIRNFQSSHHDEKKAPLHVDGQVGDMTWWALQDARPKVKKTVIPDKPNNNQQSAPQSLIDHLRLREGWRTKVYLDSLGKPTVGMGHLLTGKDINKYSVGVTIADNILTA